MNILRRNRRLRVNETIRALVRETTVTPNDFIVPLFVVEGKGVKEEIPSMPDYYRYSLDILAKEVKELWDRWTDAACYKDRKGRNSPDASNDRCRP